MIGHDVIVQAAIQPFGISCMENKKDINLFSRLTIMNILGRGGKSYIIVAISTTLVTEHGFNKDCYLNLAATAKAACMVRGYTIYGHKFGMGIPTGNQQLNNLPSNKLKDK